MRNFLLLTGTSTPAVRPIDLASYYPGDQYVDIIGIDLYDQFGNSRWHPPRRSGQAWTLRRRSAAQPDSLNDVAAFAAQHGKPISFPEVGHRRWSR